MKKLILFLFTALISIGAMAQNNWQYGDPNGEHIDYGGGGSLRSLRTGTYLDTTTANGVTPSLRLDGRFIYTTSPRQFWYFNLATDAWTAINSSSPDTTLLSTIWRLYNVVDSAVSASTPTLSSILAASGDAGNHNIYNLTTIELNDGHTELNAGQLVLHGAADFQLNTNNITAPETLEAPNNNRNDTIATLQDIRASDTVVHSLQDVTNVNPNTTDSINQISNTPGGTGSPTGRRMVSITKENNGFGGDAGIINIGTYSNDNVMQLRTNFFQHIDGAGDIGSLSWPDTVYNHTMPKLGTYLASSVNGNFADAWGNITVPVGTVSTVSVVTANGFSGTVANAATTPAITITQQNSTASQSGQLSSTDWNTFNGKQSFITAPNTANRYWNGYKNFVQLNSDSLTEGSTQLFFNNGRVDTRLNAYTGNVTFSSGVSTIGASQVTNSMLGGSIDTSKTNAVSTVIAGINTIVTAQGKGYKVDADTTTGYTKTATQGNVLRAIASNNNESNLSQIVMKSGLPVFDKSYFPTTGDFTVSGFTPLLNSDSTIEMPNGAGNFTQYMTVNVPASADNNIEFSIEGKIDTTISATSNGGGIGKLSSNSFYNGSVEIAFYPFGNSIVVYNGSTVVSTTVLPFTLANGDKFILSYIPCENIIRVSFQDVTQNTAPFVFTTTSNLIPALNVICANTSKYCIWNHGAKWKLLSAKIISRQIKYPKILWVGASKIFGNGSESYFNRLATLCQKLGVTDVLAGTGDRVEDAILHLSFDTALHAKNVLLSSDIIRNSMNSGTDSTVWQPLFITMDSAYRASGSNVILILPMPENVQNQTVAYNWMKRVFAGRELIDTTGFIRATMLATDNVHPNAFGYAFYANKILNSGFIPSDSSNYQYPYNYYSYFANPTNTANITVPGSTGNIIYNSGGVLTANANFNTSSNQVVSTNNTNTFVQTFVAINPSAGTAAEMEMGVENNNGSGTTHGLKIFLGGGNYTSFNNGGGLYNWENGPLLLGTNALQRAMFAATGNFSIGSSTTTSLFNVGSAAQFQVNSSGNPVLINNITSSFPASQGTDSSIVEHSSAGTYTFQPKILLSTGKSNSSVGTATLSSGTVTVSTTAVTASSKIFLTDATTGALTNIGTPTVGTVTAGTSFVINSSNVLDTSNINWLIIN